MVVEGGALESALQCQAGVEGVILRNVICLCANFEKKSEIRRKLFENCNEKVALLNRIAYLCSRNILLYVVIRYIASKK